MIVNQWTKYYRAPDNPIGYDISVMDAIFRNTCLSGFIPCNAMIIDEDNAYDCNFCSSGSCNASTGCHWSDGTCNPDCNTRVFTSEHLELIFEELMGEDSAIKRYCY